MTTRQYYSNWWYGTLLPLLALPGWFGISVIRPTDYAYTPLTRFVFLASGLAVIVASFSSPVFVGCLWLDARKLRASDAPWAPNPWLWGGSGVVTMCLLFLGSYLPIIAVVLGYLYRRRSRVGLLGNTTGGETT